MGLKDLLKNPNLYESDGSKGLNYPGDIPQGGTSQGPLLGRRVSFNSTNENFNPTFEIGSDIKNSVGDSFIRGGASYALQARLTDTKRIFEWATTPSGVEFLSRQAILQSQNPRPQKIYNLGINTLASVATAGVSNVVRGGPLPSVGDFSFGGFLQTATYLSELEDEGINLRGKNNPGSYGLGDPGKGDKKSIKAILKDLNPFNDKGEVGYNVIISGSIDKVNALSIFTSQENTPGSQQYQFKDFVPFRFEVINHDKQEDNVIVFRAFLDSISDDYSATHNTYKYNGRGEEFFIYNKFNRKIQVSFKIAAQSRSEMKPIYQKLNYLAAQTAPNYSSTGRIRTPYTKLTIGHWFNKLPGLITNVGLTWQKDYPWEIALDRNIISGSEGNKPSDIEGKDKDMMILPHVLDINVSFQPIHNFTPSNDIISSPFLGINGDDTNESWMKGPITLTDGMTQHELSNFTVPTPPENEE